MLKKEKGKGGKIKNTPDTQNCKKKSHKVRFPSFLKLIFFFFVCKSFSLILFDGIFTCLSALWCTALPFHSPSYCTQQKQSQRHLSGRGNVHHNSLRPIPTTQTNTSSLLTERSHHSKCPNYSKEKKRNIIMSSKLSLNGNGEYNLVEWGVAVYHEKRIKAENTQNIFILSFQQCAAITGTSPAGEGSQRRAEGKACGSQSQHHAAEGLATQTQPPSEQQQQPAASVDWKRQHAAWT